MVMNLARKIGVLLTRGFEHDLNNVEGSEQLYYDSNLSTAAVLLTLEPLVSLCVAR